MAYPPGGVRWLGKTALTGAERIWFVMDCGSEIGNAAGCNRQLAAQKQLQYMEQRPQIIGKLYCHVQCTSKGGTGIVEQAGLHFRKVMAQLKAGQEFLRRERTSTTAL